MMQKKCIHQLMLLYDEFEQSKKESDAPLYQWRIGCLHTALQAFHDGLLQLAFTYLENANKCDFSREKDDLAILEKDFDTIESSLKSEIEMMNNGVLWESLLSQYE